LTNEKHYHYHVLFDDGQFETMQSEFFMLHDWETTPSQTTPGVASVSKPNPTLVASTSQTQSRKINSRGEKRLDQYLDPNYKKKYPYFSNGDIFYEVLGYQEVGRRGKVEQLNEKKYLTNEKHYHYHVLFDDGQFETMQSEIFMLHDWETKLE
jgi:hypothetical protein